MDTEILSFSLSISALSHFIIQLIKKIHAYHINHITMEPNITLHSHTPRDPNESFTCDPLFFLGGSGFFLGSYECLGPLFLTFLYSFQLLFLKFKLEQYIKWEQCSWYIFFLFLFSLHNSLHKSVTLLLIWIFCKIPYIFNNEIWECFYQNR